MKNKTKNCRGLLSSARSISLLKLVFAGCAAGVILMPYTAQAQNLFVTDQNGGHIYEFTNNAGTLSSNYVIFASGFENALVNLWSRRRIAK